MIWKRFWEQHRRSVIGRDKLAEVKDKDKQNMVNTDLAIVDNCFLTLGTKNCFMRPVSNDRPRIFCPCVRLSRPNIPNSEQNICERDQKMHLRYGTHKIHRFPVHLNVLLDFSADPIPVFLIFLSTADRARCSTRAIPPEATCSELPGTIGSQRRA